MIATSRTGKISTAPVSARLFYSADKDCWYVTFTLNIAEGSLL